MYARVNTMQYQSGKVGEAFQIFRESILSETKRQAGFQGVTVLLDHATDKAVVITLWQTEADAKASGARSSYMQTQLLKASSLFAAAPVIEIYEVVLQE
jgi:heme-degrading monooxygenase HmoA